MRLSHAIFTEIYTGELNTSESTCSIALFTDAPPVAITRVLGPIYKRKNIRNIYKRKNLRNIYKIRI